LKVWPIDATLFEQHLAERGEGLQVTSRD